MKFSPQPLADTHALKCELAGEVLRSSGTLRLRVMGRSMLPTIWPGDTLVIKPANGRDVSAGDIVLFSNGRQFVAHRVVARTHAPVGMTVQTQGDAVPRPDSPVAHDGLLGKVFLIERSGRRIQPATSLRFPELAFAELVRRSELVGRVVVGVHGMRQDSPNHI